MSYVHQLEDVGRCSSDTQLQVGEFLNSALQGLKFRILNICASAQSVTKSVISWLQ